MLKDKTPAMHLLGFPGLHNSKQMLKSKTSAIHLPGFPELHNSKQMLHDNTTTIHLLGFPGLHNVKFLFSSLLIIVYCLIVLGNSLIIALVSVSKSLRSAMYIFLTQLSLLDILLATDILPNMIHITIHEGEALSLTSCIAQFCFFSSFECSECLLLTVMSYDRYVAICNPLHYHSVVNESFCLVSIVLTWIIGNIILLLNAISICRLHFCRSDVIDHFFCDFAPLIGLSCSNTFPIHMQTIVLCIFIVAFPFVIIVISYLCIIYTILKIKSAQGRQKAFFTCSSHLTAVSIFYLSLISVYVVPMEGQKFILSKSLSLLYTVVTPLINPAIYTLRNKDFKNAFEKWKRVLV